MILYTSIALFKRQKHWSLMFNILVCKSYTEKLAYITQTYLEIFAVNFYSCQFQQQ